MHYNKEFVPETHTYKGSTSQIMYVPIASAVYVVPE